ncbi:MAG: bifunctional adenosylcobinamide kinase/adenosylcobinamide-phosphate guanylyltransferase [Acidimicrobiales bacterium]
MATHRHLLLIGGARSGKSRLAIDLAETWIEPVTYVATATAGDDDMAARIRRHQHERPSQWTTVEAATDLDVAVEAIDADQAVVVDCITMWTANEMLGGRPADEIVEAARRLGAALRTRPTPVVVVTNEVGSGVVPATVSGRDYRDLLGRVNHCLARALDETMLVVGGMVTRLESPHVAFPELDEPT